MYCCQNSYVFEFPLLLGQVTPYLLTVCHEELFDNNFTPLLLQQIHKTPIDMNINFLLGH